ncbi:MAG TPA: YsnF/AvaK domain-containing protein [Pyrinomonadaceae bacterium]|jgi:uncharacterized protein (TIGR02271 family)
MSQSTVGSVAVTDRDGVRGFIDTSARPLDGTEQQLLVHFNNGQQAIVPTQYLSLMNDGGYFLSLSLTELAAQGGAGAQAQPERETVVMPVIAEQLDVQKRKVEAGGVRIRKIVHEREEIVDEPLIREEVQVKRVPINRVVESPVPVRHVGNTMIVSLMEEVLVVEKRLMLKEELHITKGEIETYKPQRIVLRTEEATIERVGDAPAQDHGPEVKPS